MTTPSSARRSRDAPSLRAAVAELRSDPWGLVAAAIAFLGGALTTWYALRMAAWDAVVRDLNVALGGQIIAVTPFDVIFLQARVALLVGLVLAVEPLLYSVRGALVPAHVRPAFPGWARIALVAVGAALFPVGVALGYEYAVPAVLSAVAADGASMSIVRWAGLAYYISIATGVLTQLSLVAGVLGLGRVGAVSETDGE